MKTKPDHLKNPWVKYLGLLAFCILVALAAFSSRPAGPAKADAGGWPTSTPTRTLAPTVALVPAATKTPTVDFFFPPTNTFTPVAGSNLIEQQPFAAGQPGNQANAAAQAPQSSRSILMYCLVLLIAALLIGGVVYLLLRRRGG